MTPFVPNGCGAGPTGRVVPDGLGAVEWRGCCNLHDLAYHVGGGLGAKFRADAGLARCMARRWTARARELEAPVWRRAARWLGAATLPAAYFAAVTLLGWTPATWSYRRRPVPTEAELRALEGVSHDELAELARRLEAPGQGGSPGNPPERDPLAGRVGMDTRSPGSLAGDDAIAPGEASKGEPWRP